MASVTVELLRDGAVQRSLPVTLTPPSGTLRFAADCSSLTPFTADGGFLHDVTTIPPSQWTNWHYYGKVSWVTMGGLSCCELYVPEPPSTAPVGGSSWYGACAVTLGHTAVPSWDQLGPFLSGSFYVPPGGLQITGGGSRHMVNFGELNFGGGGSPIHQAPWTFALFPDHLDFTGLTGVVSTSGAYEFNPNNTTQNTVHIIPPGGFVSGWMSYVVAVDWTFDNTGTVQTWWRRPGGAWVDNGVQYRGAPTWAWPSTMTPQKGSPSDFTQLVLNYLAAPAPGAGPTVLYRRSCYVGDTFAAVTAKLP